MIATTVIHGRRVPTDLLGELTNSTPLLDEPEQLRAAFERDGYAYFRGVLDRDVVQAARQEVLSRLEAIDEIEPGSPTEWQRDGPSATCATLIVESSGVPSARASHLRQLSHGARASAACSRR